MMYVKYSTQLILWLIAMVLGPIGYFLARYAKIGVGIWGNDNDGYGGVDPYREKEAKSIFRKFWPDFWWSVIRNPANNLARKLSASGVVVSVESTDTMTIATLGNNKKYFFYYTPKNKLMWKLGWKIWPDTIQAGDRLNAKLAFSLQGGNK